MSLGPIELFVVEFPGNQFTGAIRPEIEKLVEAGTITVIDALLVSKSDDGAISAIEIEQAGAGDDVDALASLIGGDEGLLSDEDVYRLGADLDPDSSALALVIEHSWMKPVRDAVAASNGELVANVRIPGVVVDEVVAAIEGSK